MQMLALNNEQIVILNAVKYPLSKLSSCRSEGSTEQIVILNEVKDPLSKLSS
jgi:hypothetical protein